MTRSRLRTPRRLLALITLLCLAPLAHANLIVNGDVESCALIGLPAVGASNTNCGWTFSNSAGVESFDGGKVIRLESAGSALSDPIASQTVSGLTIGDVYTLSWDRRVRVAFGGLNNGPSFGVFLDQLLFADALFLLPTGTNNAVFANESVQFTATATTHTVIFAGELDGRTNNAGTTDISHRLDNVSLLAAAVNVAAPVPMALIGLGALVLARRRLRGC